MFKKIIKIVLVIALITLIVIQFIHPEKNNGGYESVATFENETKPSVQVATLLKENCYDCHSNQTQYPWYSNIAPVSFWQADHIKHGKHHFNASEWNSLTVKKKEHTFKEIEEVIEKGEMPIDSYTWMHGDLSLEQTKLILQWVRMARLQFKNQLEVSSR